MYWKHLATVLRSDQHKNNNIFSININFQPMSFSSKTIFLNKKAIFDMSDQGRSSQSAGHKKHGSRELKCSKGQKIINKIKIIDFYKKKGKS